MINSGFFIEWGIAGWFPDFIVKSNVSSTFIELCIFRELFAFTDILYVLGVVDFTEIGATKPLIAVDIQIK